MRIGAVAARTGMSTSALRAWEERYGILRPQRTAGGHRQYTDDDVARVVAVRALVAAGHTVASAAANLADPEAGANAVRYSSLAAAYAATRAIIAADDAAALVDALEAFVRVVGGTVVPASDGGPETIPLDIGLGEQPPELPAAPPGSVARIELERLLPPLVDDARSALARLHLARRSKGGTVGQEPSMSRSRPVTSKTRRTPRQG